MLMAKPMAWARSIRSLDVRESLIESGDHVPVTLPYLGRLERAEKHAVIDPAADVRHPLFLVDEPHAPCFHFPAVETEIADGSSGLQRACAYGAVKSLESRFMQNPSARIAKRSARAWMSWHTASEKCVSGNSFILRIVNRIGGYLLAEPLRRSSAMSRI
jgi:hypothetical protein